MAITLTTIAKLSILSVCFSFASIVSASASRCKCSIKQGQNGARLLSCTALNGAQAYAYATGLTTRTTNSCILRTWDRKITEAQGAFGLCSPCQTGAQANACVKYARDVVQDWCASKPPKMDQPRCKCTAKSNGTGKSIVSCAAKNGSVSSVNVSGLDRNAKELGECFNRNIPLAVGTLYCRPCMDADRARSCVKFIKYTAKSLCYDRKWFSLQLGDSL